MKFYYQKVSFIQFLFFIFWTMKYHSQLIKKYIAINDTPENIANNLILKTVEIEEIINRKIDKHIVIWKVISAVNHPDSDHMSVCQVDLGPKWQFQIVCGAANVQWAKYVAVAMEWAVFEKAWITIAPRKLRGVDSNGMICSKNELWINEDTDKPWIWELDKDLEVLDEDLWTPLTDKFEWLDSYVLDIDNKWLTNRPDLTGHFGVAWEFNSMYQPQWKISFSALPKYQQDFSTTNMLDLLENWEKKWKKSVIWETEWLNNYILLELNNVTVSDSDFYMRLQNADLGNGSVNNWVDFSNIFMNISWNPVHFFDADKIEGNIHIRDAYEWEKFVDLFEKEHILTPQDIVIADDKKALCLWWIMWWLNSWVTSETKNILVEIANFDPVRIRKTWVRLWLRSDSELRNEKHIAPTYSLYALLLFLDELKFYAKDLWNFEIWGISSYVKPWLHPVKPTTIEVDWDNMNQFIFGVDDKKSNFQEKASEILKNLWFEVEWNQVTVPLWRWPDDITISADVAEEVARIWGYEEIKSTAPLTEIKSQSFIWNTEITRIIEECLVEKCDFDQWENYPWVSEKMVQPLGKVREDFITLTNPVNPECPLLRDTFLYQFLQVASKNSKFFDNIRYFDIGKIWTKNQPENSVSKEFAAAHLDEQLHLGFFMYKKSINSWKEDTLLEAKSVVETILHDCELTWKITYEATDLTHFHPKKQGKILFNKQEIWVIWTVHPIILKASKLPENANLTFVEISLEKLKELRSQGTEKTYIYETMQDQILWRDLSFVINETEDFSKVLSAIRKIEDIKDIRVFDVYQWENLPSGKKSVSLQIKIMWDGNMTSEQIGAVMQKAIDAVSKVWWELRG